MSTGTAWEVDGLVVLCGGAGGGLLPDNNLVPVMGKLSYADVANPVHSHL